MKQLKALIAGIVIGLLIGLWFGVNLGRDKAIFSNPFEADTLQDKIRETGETIIEKSGEALEKGGKALKDKVQEAQ